MNIRNVVGYFLLPTNFPTRVTPYYSQHVLYISFSTPNHQNFWSFVCVFVVFFKSVELPFILIPKNILIMPKETDLENTLLASI